MADDFESACDRLSQSIDEVQFERLRWSRTEAPMLAHLQALAQSVFEGRPDFELTEEGATESVKRYVIKVHSMRVAAVNIALQGRTVAMWAEQIARGRGQVAADSQRVTAEFDAVDKEWMNAAFATIFSEIQ